MLGITPQSVPAAPAAPPPMNIGGFLPVMGLATQMAEQVKEESRRLAQQAQSSQPISELAGHVRHCWSTAKSAKEQTVEPRMFQSMRQRRGEYDPEVLGKIRQTQGSEIYMMLTAVKCRAAAAWLRDTLLGQRNEKPWTLRPTPVPTLSPEKVMALREQAIAQLTELYMMTGVLPPESQIRSLLEEMRDEFMVKQQEQATKLVERMEMKMEDQLVEGSFHYAMSQFVDDLTTFPSAIVKGPIVRKKPKMQWVPGKGGQFTLDYKEDIVLEWERVSPFDIYPSPDSENVNDGYLIERHKLRRADLEQLKGVEGYDSDSIDLVLDEYGRGGLQNWTANDSERALAEGKDTSAVMSNPEGLIDALQFWGSVQGKMLQEWGVEGINDELKEYNCEIWVIGNYVIKADLNYHPAGLKPYFKSSYEEIPGTFWGNSVADLCRDTQNMCNATARAISNNMGIASGPQVGVNVDRLPPGEDITQMYPWKIWQFTDDISGANTKDPVIFFQPESNVQQLMAVYEKFSALADEHTGIPRYMTGDSPAQGAGRTASGMSMLQSNASKTIKQVVALIDVNVMTPLLERLYFWNMKYNPDNELKGDVNIVARGAMSLIQKETAQVRRNEWLMATANPFDMQIVGMEGRAEVLRETTKTLDMPNPDKIVPSPEKLRLRQAMVAAQAMQQQQPQGGPSPGGQELKNGAPATDNFSPPRMH
jgi:hypothetical protein